MKAWAAIARGFAFAWTCGVYAYLLVAPSYQTTSSSSAGTYSTGTQTLIEVNGRGVLITLGIPVAVAALALVPIPSGRRVLTGISAFLLLGFVVLGAASIGMFYLPAALALLVASLHRGSHLAAT